MYCQECGSKLPDNAKFCMNCGTKVWVEETAEEVKEVIEEIKAEEIIEETVEEVVEEDNTEYAVTEEPAAGGDENLEAEQAEATVAMLKKIIKKTGKANKKLLAVIAGVVVLLAVVIGGFFAYLENRTLYTLINPEEYFGKHSSYTVMESAPGESLVIVYFRSETDFLDKVVEYADFINWTEDELYGELYEAKNEIIPDGPFLAHISWRFAPSDDLWYDYSFCEDNADEITILYSYSEYYGEYEVALYIEGYQNCRFLDIGLDESVDATDNTVTSGDKELSEQPEEPSEPSGETSEPSGTQTAAKPTSKPKATPTPKMQVKVTATPAPSKTKELVTEEIDVATAVQPPKNAFQDFASWGQGAVVSEDAEQSDSDTQYLDYQASQETVDAYIEMLLQNGFTLVDDYFFQYQSAPFASWALNCDYVPDAGKVDMQYQSSTTCHLCISTYEGDYTFEYSSDLTQYDFGLRKDGSVEETSVNGPSAGAGLYRTADGIYTTTDGRLSASMNKATIIRDGKNSVCTARSEIKNGREWVWVEDYYRNEAICFGVLQDYTMAGDLYQLQDLKREKYFNDDKDVYFYKWGDQPIFEMTVDGDFTGPLVTAKNKFEEVTVRVMYYEEGEEAVYYIYAKTNGTPSEIEVLCAVGLNVEEAENDAENAIVLSVGETHTLTYYANVFGALSEVYSWSISGGDGIYADGTGSYCKVTAMKKGTGKVTVTCRYTVSAADILTGNPTTEQRTKSKTWYFKVE